MHIGIITKTFLAANTYVWSPAVAAVTPLIYLSRRSSRGEDVSSETTGGDGDAKSGFQTKTRYTGSLQQATQGTNRGVADILKGDSPELAKLRDAV